MTSPITWNPPANPQDSAPTGERTSGTPGALGASRRATSRDMDTGADATVDAAHAAASQTLQRTLDRTQELGQHTLDAVRDGSQQLRRKVEQASDASAGYIRGEPIKSVLMAAAAGAALMALGSLFARSRRAGG